MKKLACLALACGLVFSFCGITARPAAAVDIKASGYWDFNFEWNNLSFSKPDPNDVFHARQRLRTQVDIIASETLKGTVFFEIGDTNWGNTSQGGSLGTDGTTVEIRYSYIDWQIPDSNVKVRMGLQNFALPYFVADSPILDDDAAGITLSYTFNENAALSLFWMRPENNNDLDPADRGQSDASDFFGLSLPLTGESWQLNPWAVYANLGRNSLKDPTNCGDIAYLRSGLLPYTVDGTALVARDANSPAWWLGLGGEMKTFAPFRLAMDLAYGKADWGRARDNSMPLSRSGWLGIGLAEYKMQNATPGLIFWYGSGDNANPNDGSEQMPTISPSWAGTTLAWDGAYGIAGDSALNVTPTGTWGLIAQITDISFVENLSHTLALGYYTGTNNTAMVERGAVSGIVSDNVYLTTKDHAWELNFNTSYQIYSNLTLMIELNYLRLDLDNNVWGATLCDVNKNAYKAGINLRYAF